MRDKQTGFKMEQGNILRKENDYTSVEWINKLGEKGPPKIRFKTLITTSSSQIKGYIDAQPGINQAGVFIKKLVLFTIIKVGETLTSPIESFTKDRV